MKDHFGAYGWLAEHADDPTVVAGRRAFQRGAEARLVSDVAAKLGLAPECRLLEVGCGLGNLLGGLAPLVAESTGIDHPSVVARARASLPTSVRLIGGRWPEVDGIGPFDRILVYSVLHYLDGPPAAERFISACIDVLAPGGKLLLGDLPNRDAAARFAATATGLAFAEEWRRRVEADAAEHPLLDEAFAGLAAEPFIGDEFILGTVARWRAAGLEAYLLPQSPDLPFGWSREDVLLWKRPK